MSDFYNSMGPLAALSLFGLMGNKNKKRGGMSGLVEPTQPRDARSEKQDLGLGFNFRSPGPDPRGTRTLAPREERQADASKRREKIVATRTKRQEIDRKAKPELDRLRKELREAKKRERAKQAQNEALDTSSYSGLLA